MLAGQGLWKEGGHQAQAVTPEKVLSNHFHVLRITSPGSVLQNLAHCFGTEIKKEDPQRLKFFVIPSLISFPPQEKTSLDDRRKALFC